MKIFVKSEDFGFWTQEDITVQRVDFHEDEDEPYKDVLWCNHAGATEEDTESEYMRSDGTVMEISNKALICDKCYAYKCLDEEYWQDAPTEGVR